MNRSDVRRGLALLFSVVLLTAACGTNQGGGGAATPGGGGASPGGASPAGQLSGELTVWAMGNEGVLLGDFAKEFTNQNPNVKIDVTPVDWGQASQKLLTAIGGNQTPDVSQMGTDMMGQFIKTGALEPVPATIDKSKYFEGAWNTGVGPDGQAYSVPWYVETRVLYYRTDIAEKAGITKAPETWDELKAMAKALKAKGGAQWGISLGTKNWQEFLPFVWSNGGDIVKDGQFTLNSPEAVEALSFYDSFFEESLTPKQVPEGFDITNGFVAGTHPMFFSGPWHLGLIKDLGKEKIEGKWAIAPMPRGKSDGVSFVGGGNMVVYRNAKNKDLAWAFVRWLTDPKTQVGWYEKATVLPSDQTAWSDAKISADPNVKVFGEQLKKTKAQPAIPTWAEIQALINDTLEKVTAGNMSPQAGADAMQQQAQSVGTE
jgi:multiple sugar transport system substrate-binding protein